MHDLGCRLDGLALIAAEKGHVLVLRALVELGANIHLADVEGQPKPAHVAAASGQVAILKELSDLGFSLDVQDKSARRPAHYAARHNQVASLRMLNQLGVNLSALGYADESPIHTAALSGQLEALSVLVELGVDLNVQNSEGKTALCVAIEYATEERVIALLAALDGFNLSLVSDGGLTLAHYAASSNKPRVLSRLYELGADITAENDDGITPQKIAEVQRREEVLNVFHRLRAIEAMPQNPSRFFSQPNTDSDVGASVAESEKNEPDRKRLRND